MDLDGNTFFLTNKKYPHARLAQWGIKGRKMGTYEQKVYPDQLWILKVSPEHPEYFYIYNAYNEGYRMAKWGKSNKKVGIYNEKYYGDQLWKFVNTEDNYYRIFNYKYDTAKITKFGRKDGNWGTSTGPDCDEQIWKLEPRFEADIREDVIWSCDNRQGSKPFEEEVEVTKGLKVSSGHTVTTKNGFKQSLRASFNFAIAQFGDLNGETSTELYRDLETSVTSSEEKSWSRTSRIKFCAPASKNYRVKQLTVYFASPIEDDNCALKCAYKVEESDQPFEN